jgi:hypothetical protein
MVLVKGCPLSGHPFTKTIVIANTSRIEFQGLLTPDIHTFLSISHGIWTALIYSYSNTLLRNYKMLLNKALPAHLQFSVEETVKSTPPDEGTHSNHSTELVTTNTTTANDSAASV